ncbi:MAG: DUF1192 domain-containing protein [Rhodospirillaceae bacterium]|nr:DUF1192 domain-containing protein [Rhodospirillaceae bacterium]|tara:strand:+ start:850 stop:1044 length:195 start_codon:yes stop_codon:yes gene_type:complete
MTYDDDTQEENKQDYLCIDLENLSLEELREYILFLEREIKRTNFEISSKTIALGEANSVFKTKN